MFQAGAEMKIAVVTSLAAKGYMYVNASHKF